MERTFGPTEILLPHSDFSRWAVAACDQFTSQPEYWEQCSTIVGDAPSALKMILPEAFIHLCDARYIETLNRQMEQYVQDGLFDVHEDCMIYVEREVSTGLRRGIVGGLRLADYDYRKGSTAAVRATEQTVAERIPPRVQIRAGACLELPHVMLLMDDPADTVLGLLTAARDTMTLAYDFDLMQGGGHIRGYFIPQDLQEQALAALERLRRDDGFLLAVGDGNHSLAAAKECAKQGGERAQVALTEVVNIHDASLQFEPIYRVVMGKDAAALASLVKRYLGESEQGQAVTLCYGDTEERLCVPATSHLTVGTVQNALDRLLADDPTLRIDYIHGENVVHDLCRSGTCVGLLFDGMQKQELFDAVSADGCLPRKTFSMGHAEDKRYYLEARKIG